MVRFDARRFAFEAALSSLELGSPELPVQLSLRFWWCPLILTRAALTPAQCVVLDNCETTQCELIQYLSVTRFRLIPALTGGVARVVY